MVTNKYGRYKIVKGVFYVAMKGFISSMKLHGEFSDATDRNALRISNCFDHVRNLQREKMHSETSFD